MAYQSVVIMIVVFSLGCLVHEFGAVVAENTRSAQELKKLPEC